MDSEMCRFNHTYHVKSDCAILILSPSQEEKEA